MSVSNSMSLITAQISFLEPRLALIHIPLEYYSFFLQPIFRVLFGEDDAQSTANSSWTSRHEFLNVSITPVECSVICPRDLADRFFTPLAKLFNSAMRADKHQRSKVIEISQEDYIVVQVDGEGLDAGQRVLELTSPLAMAGISIFFLTTYFSDYILVPHHAQRTVTKALEQRGFIFSQSADAFVSQLSPSSPTATNGNHPHGFFSNTDMPPPSTPPAKDIPELQTRTFTKLKQNSIKPVVYDDIRLLSCAGSKEPDRRRDNQLKEDLLHVLLSTFPVDFCGQSSPGLGLTLQEAAAPISDLSTRFLSLTLTSTEPISILMESRLADHLGKSVLGAKEVDDILVPITLDLRKLPMHSTGIVCGVAGRLAQGTKDPQSHGSKELSVDPLELTPPSRKSVDAEPIEISFLSTARAGTVVVKASELDRAVKALEQVTEVNRQKSA